MSCARSTPSPRPFALLLFAVLFALGATAGRSGDGEDPLWLTDPAEHVALEPAATVDDDGRAWIAWLAWTRAEGRIEVGVEVACYEGGRVVARRSVAPDRPLPAAPSLAPIEGGVYCAWEEGEGGDRAVTGRVLRLVGGEVRPGPLEVVAPGGLGPRLVRTAPGRLEAVVQLAGGADAYGLAHTARRRGQWTPLAPVFQGRHETWWPRVASRGDGNLHLVYDAWDGRSHDVHYARLKGGRVRDRVRVAGGPQHQAFADVDVAPDGTAWTVWESAGSFGESGPLRKERSVHLAAVAGGELRIPAGGSRISGPRERADLPRVAWVGAGPAVTWRTIGDETLPDLELDASQRRDFNRWLTRLVRFGEEGAALRVLLDEVDGDNDATEVPLALGDGQLALVFAADDRGRAGPSAVPWRSVLEQPWRVGLLRSQGSFGAPALEAAPEVEPPAASRASSEARRVADDVFFGDLHRHTHLSRCHGADDGTPLDQIRYARGPGGLDFLAITDHWQHLPPWSMWRSARDAERWNQPGRLVVFAGFENIRPDEAHQNHVYADAAELLAELGGYELRDDALPEVQAGRWIGIPHMMASDRGELTWDTVERTVHRVFELFQGIRGSYEGPSLPYVARDFEEGSWTFAEGFWKRFPIGVIASSDHASSGTSYAGVRAEELTRAGVFEALWKRNTFASTHRAFVDLRLGELRGGQRGAAAADAPLRLEAYGPTPVAAVEIVKNRGTLARVAGEGERETFVLSLRTLGFERLSLWPEGEGLRISDPRTRRRPGRDLHLALTEDGRLDLRKGAERVDVLFDLELGPDPQSAALVFELAGESRTVPLAELAQGRSTRLDPLHGARTLWRMGSPLGQKRFQREFEDPGREPGDTYYARVSWVDGNVTWTSPVGVDRLE